MDKKLFDFLLAEDKFTLEQVEKLYEWDKAGEELANKITDIMNNKPGSVCELAMEERCSRCPIYRVKCRLPESSHLSCNDIYIILELLKEGK